MSSPKNMLNNLRYLIFKIWYRYKRTVVFSAKMMLEAIIFFHILWFVVAGPCSDPFRGYAQCKTICPVQYRLKFMHTVTVSIMFRRYYTVCWINFVVVRYWSILFISVEFRWHCYNDTIYAVPMKQPWRILVCGPKPPKLIIQWI